MEPKIKRKYRSFPVLLSSSEPGSVSIRIDDVAGGAVSLGPSPTTVTTLEVWASDSASGPYGRLRKTDGSAVEVALSPSTSEARVYPLPEECYGVGAIKLVGAIAGATAVTCVVMLKG